MKKVISFGLVLGILPSFVLGYSNSNLGTILDQLIGYLNYIVPALITIAVIYFIWGVISFMTASDEEAKKMGRTKIINGLIGLFVIVTFWGIVGIVQRTFGVDNMTNTGIVPCVPNSSNHMGLDC
jgi:hypothetical protein